MSEPFRCKCGRQTREPFLWHGELLCAVCMEQDHREIVDARERAQYQEFRRHEDRGDRRWGRQLA